MLVIRTLAALAFFIALASPSRAQIGFTEYQWNNPAGGDYATAANWTPTGIPNTSSERATFNLNATYAVTLPSSDVSVLSAAVPSGNVTLNFPNDGEPYSYTANIGLSVASSGQASLNLTLANLATGTATVGVNAGSDGRLTLDSVGVWNNTGAVVIGAAGSGRLELLASELFAIQSQATTASAVLGQSAGSSGEADVAGVWNSGDLIVGNSGTGEVNVRKTFNRSNGQLRSGAASIAAQPGSAGTVNVFGYTTSITPVLHITGVARWGVAESLSIGGSSAAPGGSGRLAVGEYNDIFVGGDLRIWPGGTLSLARERLFFTDGKITVDGAARLGGALEVTLPPSSGLQIGDEFVILTAAGGVTGTFNTTSLTPLGNGRAWIVDYNPNSVVARVVVGSSFAAADFEQDEDVDRDDLARWRANYGTGTMRMQGNADGDLDVDGADFLTWQRQLGNAATMATVPEPATGLLLVSGTLAMFRRRREVV